MNLGQEPYSENLTQG